MTSTGRSAATGPAAPPAAERREPGDHSALVARTRDLADKLTALADRYDALPPAPHPARERERVVNIALMRLAAASGSRLLGAGAPPGQEQPERPLAGAAWQAGSARARDVAAQLRDGAAELRDLRASLRDRRARATTSDLDPGFADRFLAATDRDAAAGDRADAIDDRAAARRDRQLSGSAAPAREPAAEGLVVDLSAVEQPAVEQPVAAQPPDPRHLLEQLSARATFHQAQGLLMAKSGMNASQAFEALLLDAQQRDTSMTEAAMRLVRELSTTTTGELLSGPGRHGA